MVLRNILKALIIVVVMGVGLVARAESINVGMKTFWNDVEPSSQIKVNHSVWQTMLDKYLDDKHPSGVNRFDYDSVTEEDEQALKDYIRFLQNYDPRQFNVLEQKAFWLNLHNAAVVSLVIEKRLDDSIKEMRGGNLKKGLWKRKVFQIATKKLSFNDLRNGILRPIVNDELVHYGLNYATLSSPSLPKQAYSAKNVDALLEQSARQFVNSDYAVKIEGENVILSTMYDWYKDDFGDVLTHINKYADDDLKATLSSASEIEFGYDWDLNKKEDEQAELQDK